MEIENYPQLILARVEILKLMANDHDWQCYVSDDIKTQIVNTLKEIDKRITNFRLSEKGIRVKN